MKERRQIELVWGLATVTCVRASDFMFILGLGDFIQSFAIESFVFTGDMLACNLTELRRVLSLSQFDLHSFADLVRSQIGLCRHVIAVLNKHELEEPTHVQDKLAG